MSLARYLRGYDKRYETLRDQHDIPTGELPFLQELVGPAADDPDLFDPHPLGGSELRRLAQRLGITTDEDRYDYYVEAEEDWRRVAQMRDAISA